MAAMVRKFSIDTGDMALALVLWLCSLSLVGLFVAPFSGLKVGAIVAVALFWWLWRFAGAFAVGRFTRVIPKPLHLDE